MKMKYKFKAWHLLIAVALVLVLNSHYGFLGSIQLGQQRDFLFSHFAYGEDEGGYLLWTSDTYELGDVVMKTSKVGYDGCATLTMDGKVHDMCKGDSFMYNDYVKIVFNPVMR